MIQVLIDADNLTPAQLTTVVEVLPADDTRIVVAGSPAAVGSVSWPPEAGVHVVSGPEQADALLLGAYEPLQGPLVLVTGDGDFAVLARAHAGPVLVLSGRPAGRLRAAAEVLDPLRDKAALRAWLDAVVDRPWG